MLVDLAVAAEAGGWDGVFLWDHVVYRPPIRAVADPWVALSVIAALVRLRRFRSAAYEAVLIGPIAVLSG